MGELADRVARTEAAELVAESWRALDIPFVVGHGLEEYPHRLGRDLDILMDRENARKALRDARRVLTEAGWPTIVCPPALWGERLVALAPNAAGNQDYLELHTAPRFAWMALPLATPEVAATSWIGPFPTNAWVTFAKVVLLPLLAGDTSKFTTRYLESTRRQVFPAAQIESALSDLVGSDLSAQLLAATATHDAERLTSLRSDVRRRCLVHMGTHPASTARNLLPFMRKRFGRFFSNSGARIRIAAPPDIDGNRLANEVKRQLEHIFVVTHVGRPRPWYARPGQRYDILSRQGLILEVGPPSTTPQVVMTTPRALGPLSQRTLRFPTGGNIDELAEWILHQWAESLRCR